MSSTPLRRKSHRVLPHLVEDFPINDDIAELHRRRSELVQRTPNNALERRQSFGFSAVSQLSVDEMKEQLEMCMKLNVENKINLKNAFSLNVIDIMSYLTLNNSSNLQVASSSLDASSKVYSLRVDSVYSQVLKMVGVLEKQDTNDESRQDLNLTNPEINNPEEEQVKKKKKKKRHLNVLVGNESLQGKIDAVALSSLVPSEGDPQTTDKLFQSLAMLCVGSDSYITMFNFPICDELSADNDKGDDDKIFSANTPRNMDTDRTQLAPPFKFLNWSIDNEEQENDTHMDVDDAMDDDHDDFRFNIEDDLPDPTPFPATQEMEILDRQRAEKQHNENLVDMQGIISTSILNNSREYSYIPKLDIIHLSVPAYWKIKPVSHGPSNNKVVDNAAAKGRKKKDVILDYEDADTENLLKQFQLGTRTKYLDGTLDTWQAEDNHIYYEDPNFDPKSMFCLEEKPVVYSHVKYQPAERGDHQDPPKKEDVVTENCDIDYHARDDFHDDDDNEADMNNDVQNESMPPVAESMDHQDVECSQTQVPLTGSNLIQAPEYTQEMNIPYSKKEKKLDIRQFKGAMRSIIGKETAGDVETLFSKIYNVLPTKLSKSNIAARSVPIAFVSLLHIANEQTLHLSTIPNKSDIIVKRDFKS